MLATATPAGPASIGRGAHGHGVRLTSMTLPASFLAQEVVAAAGKVWVLGTTWANSATECALEEVTPATMTSTLVPLPACATYITAGGGRIFSWRHQASRPTTSGSITSKSSIRPLTSPTCCRQSSSATSGARSAHMGFTYGGGALWLYGYQYPAAAPTVVRISPTSGAVESTIGSVPGIGGIFPTVAADHAGTWLGGGPGGPPGVQWVRPGAATGTTAYAGPPSENSSVLWLSTVGDRIWAGIAVYGQGRGATKTSVTTHLVALRPDGSVAIVSPAEATSDIPLVASAGGTRLSGPRIGHHL